MKKKFSKAVKIGTTAKVAVVGLALSGTSAMANVTMPSPVYDDIEAAAAIGFAVVLTVGLLMKAKRFFA